MDDRAFDRLTRLVAAPGTRRDQLRAALSVVVASRLPAEADAAKRRKKKKKKRPNPPANPTCNPPCSDGQRCCAQDTCRDCCGNTDCSAAEPVCTDAGQCVECLSANDCPDPGQCRTRDCTAGNTCVPQVAQDGTNPRDACPGSKVCCNGGCKDCCNVGDCTRPSDGTVDCKNGVCDKRCDNNQFLVCNEVNACQECCKDNDCRYIDPDATCGNNGTCNCLGGEERCGDTCVPIKPNNCGECDHTCSGGTCDGDDCRDAVICRPICIQRVPGDCEFPECPGEKVCQELKCVCPIPGTVDCNGDNICESCGQCGLGPCPPDPATGQPGFCCPDGSCSCGGVCCNGGMCYVSAPRTGEGPLREQCVAADSCVECRGLCCSACINGDCVHTTPISGGSIRRR